MAQTLLITPEGDQELVPEENVERARQEFGYRTPEEHDAAQRAEQLGAVGGAAQEIAAPVVGLMNLGVKSGLLSGGETPEEQAQVQQGTRRFGLTTAAAEQAHPLATEAGKLGALGTLGLVSSGAGSALAGAAGASPLLGAGAGLLSESAVTGVSQEAVDAVTANRDFSGKAALMNGGMNLLFGGLFAGGGHLLEGTAARRAGELAAEAGEGLPGQRNILREVDPGEVPEAIQGGGSKRKGQAESAGAASKDFDELDAAKAIREIKTGKVAPGPVAGAAPAIREHLSVESARSADALDSFLRDDANLGVKHQDFAKGAAEWTPEIKAAQDEWLSTMEKQAIESAERVRNMRHAGGLGEAAATEIEKGLERARDAAGNGDWAGRNVAVDNMKRGVDQFINRLGAYGNAAVDAETRSALIRELRENVADPLREGLENPSYFGRNAEIQVAHNQPIHEMIEPLKRVQRRLYEVTGRKWGEIGETAVERRADPDAFRRLFEDPHGGGKLFQKDLSEALDRAEDLARNRAEHGLSHLEGIDSVVDHLQQIRNDLNTAQVLRFAESQVTGGAHGAGGGSALGAIGSNALIHAAEFAGRAVGFPIGNIVRSTGAMAKGTHMLDELAVKFGGGELAKAGTATRSVLDRYASRVKGSELLADEAHTAGLPENLKRFLEKSHAQQSVPRPPSGGAPAGGGEGSPGPLPEAPAANDTVRRGTPVPEAPAAVAPKLEPKLQSTLDTLTKSGQPMTKGQLGNALRGYGTAEWEVEELKKRGLIREVPQDVHEKFRKEKGWDVDRRYELVPQPPPGAGGAGRAAAGLAVAGGAGALLASGNAGAAELLPDQQAARDQIDQHLQTLLPDQQQQQIQTAEAFARIGQRVDQRVQGAVTDLFALAKDPKAPPRYRSPQAKAIDQKAADLDVPRHLARFMGKHDDPVDAFREKSKTITAILQDPSRLASHMAQNLGDLPRDQPEIFAAMVGQTMQAVEYLGERMPGASGQSAIDPQGYPPTFEEISEWAGHFVGAMHPLDSLDDLASNELVPEQIEAVQALWPEGYQRFQTAAMAQIHELSKQKKTIPLDALQQIDNALDLDGAGEPVLSSAMAQLIQQAESQDEQTKQQSQGQKMPPMQSQSPQRLSSSALGSLHSTP